MSEEKIIFEGSLMDGVNEHLPSWCGLSLSDEEEDKIWMNTNSLDLIMNCPSIDYYEEEVPDIPLYSDTYYKFVVSSSKQLMNLKDELKKEILFIIQKDN